MKITTEMIQKWYDIKESIWVSLRKLSDSLILSFVFLPVSPSVIEPCTGACDLSSGVSQVIDYRNYLAAGSLTELR